MDLNFNIQKHTVLLSPRASGDIEYKQRKNWSSPNAEQRQRANLMFDRIHQALFNLANCSDFSIYSRSPIGEYQCIVTDGFAVINFELYKTDDSLVVYIKNFIWTYKNDPDNWWYIVENKYFITNNTMKNKKVIRLTESDLHNVIKESVQQVLMEMDPRTYASYADKRRLQAQKYDVGSPEFRKYQQKATKGAYAATNAWNDRYREYEKDRGTVMANPGNYDISHQYEGDGYADYTTILIEMLSLIGTIIQELQLVIVILFTIIPREGALQEEKRLLARWLKGTGLISKVKVGNKNDGSFIGLNGPKLHIGDYWG